MKYFLSLLLIFTLALSANSFAQKAGLVLMAKGTVFATDNTGKKRALRRRSAIMQGDTISTEANGKLQIRFIDKALLTLKPNSKLDISAYQQAKTEGEGEEVVMNLITGGFRTITGSIGKGDKSAYTVKTPAASIGIRGTNYEVAQETGGNFVMAVWEGGITVSNDQGSMKLGQGGDYSFVRVSSSSEPKGLDKAPDSLKTTTPPPPKKEKKDSEEKDSKDGKDSEKSDKDSNKEKDGESDDEESDQDTAENTDESSDENEESDEQTAGNTTSDESSNPEADAKDSELEDSLEESEEQATAIIEEPLEPLDIETSNDSRFSDFAYTHLLKRPRAGLLVNNDTGDMQNALVVNDSDTATNPTIAIPGANLGNDNNLNSFTLDPNSASSSGYVEKVAGSSFISWGKWNGSVDVFNSNNISSSVNKDFYWLSAEAAALSSLRGTAQFSGDQEFLGDINGESINSLNGQFDVNFTSGTIENGSLTFASDSQTWDMSFDGAVTGSQATMGNIQGGISDSAGTALCSTCVQGNVQGTFARPGDNFAGGMQLESTDATNKAQGVFLLKGERQ